MSVPVLYELRAAMLLGSLVRAVDRFEETINFYMDDDAWDALTTLSGAAADAATVLSEAGYGHLISQGVA